MKYYNGENFDEIVKEGIILVDFYADWCGPCKMLGNVLEEVKNDINILKVNIDKYPELANKFGVMSIPHLVFFKDGREANFSTGLISKSTLLELIEEVKNI